MSLHQPTEEEQKELLEHIEARAAKRKKEQQFVKITGILRSPFSGINFAFLIKMETMGPLETYKIIHDNHYGNKFMEFLENRLHKYEDDEFLYYHWSILSDIEKKLGDYYYEDESGLKIVKCKSCGCKENEATAYLDLDYITEKEFNNSDKWKTPSKTRIREIIKSSKRNRTCDGWDM